MSDYEKIADFLHSIGWRSICDAQWERLRDALPDLRELLQASPPSGGEVVYVAHKFWGAGEPDCPADIKASNGELHTLRCKVCGKNSDRNPCSAIVSRQVTEEMIDAAYEAYADMYDVEYTQGSHIDNRRACIKAALQAALESNR